MEAGTRQKAVRAVTGLLLPRLPRQQREGVIPSPSTERLADELSRVKGNKPSMAPMWLQDCCQLGIDVPGVFVQSLSAPSMDIESVTAGKTTTPLVVGFVCESCKFEVS